MFTTELVVGFTSVVDPAAIDKPYLISQNDNHVEITWKDVVGEIVLFDVYGRLMDSVSDDVSHDIDVSSFLPGIYFVRLELDGSIWVEKILSR